MKKILIIFITLFIFPVLIGASSYNYSYWGTSIHSAPGLTYIASIHAETLRTSIEDEEERQAFSLSSPEDIVVYDNKIYLVDKSENAMIIINEDFELHISKTEFDYSPAYLASLGSSDITSASLSEPYGIDVTESGIFICDTGNHRIIKLNHDYEVENIFSEIEEATFEEVLFEPIKITVDPTDRMYVVAKNIYEGILEINSDGTFNRYTGVNPIKLTPFEIFSRSLMTEEQIAQLQLFLPTEYTNVNINESNFIYATSKVSENNAENPIQLINPKGVDVIKRNGYFPPMGDIQYVEGMNNYVIDGPSRLVDIAYTDDGIYTVLDQKRSRLFTYDSEGNLLYIDGDEGRQTDKFSEGVAIDYFGDDLLVLDRKTKTIIVYGLTEFGSYVNQAIHFHNEGMFEEAAEIWEKVIQINSNYEIAYNGIGKMLLREERYEEAMEYFRLGYDQYYYSKAFQEYRNNMLKENFGYIMGGILLIAGLLIGRKIRKIYKKGGSILYED